MKSTITTFKIWKSSWGIWIRIKGKSEEIEEGEIEFKLQLENLELQEEELNLLQEGFESVVTNIKANISKPVKITISRIELVLTDYQREGLYYAIRQWLSEHFGFKLPEFEYGFDKVNNRYEFPELNK